MTIKNLAKVNKKLSFIEKFRTSNINFLNNTKAKVGFSIIIAYALLAIIGPYVAPYNAYYSGFPSNLPPSFSHLLGTDAYGRDIFSRLLVGAAPTLGIGLLVGLVATLISIIVGISAGAKGGIVDSILDGLSYVFIIIPGIMFIILIGSMFIGRGISFGYGGILIALIVTGWGWGARVLRSQTKSLVTRNFIISSKLIGENSFSIIFRQIIRNMFPLILSNFFFASMYGVLGLTWIEFFGLGNVDSVNWGTMLYWAVSNEAYLSGEWWWYIPVSLLIAGLASGFALMNSGFDEIANPSLAKFKKLQKVKAVNYINKKVEKQNA
ncbi:ABC transporter permease [Picrophilus oshimae]|uniref:Oligopeptide ABC transporter Opp2, permease protein n=1 Tax=Picrophilus torridus (strain ATCC 700027 / DSM 9790 / JCM 10055 / NBRC 100828 / KAW 2/3) TaxID=1122961 RepID=Q6KZ18_PICTO|nr:ABC transporter permease [Picrophilus oshimae]AAT44034.1 oligopeptide ABC transporter Opp2, permease protein [Picrophilus oshimae DSM 9789]